MSKEIDAMVAREVFGHKVCLDFHDGRNEPILVVGIPNPYKLCPEVPPYSSDIAAAWLIVEKMRKHDWSVTIGQHIDLSWRCKFTDDETLIEVISTAPTASEAICLAALEAVNADQ
jgi:hypothetical protein